MQGAGCTVQGVQAVQAVQAVYGARCTVYSTDAEEPQSVHRRP